MLTFLSPVFYRRATRAGDERRNVNVERMAIKRAFGAWNEFSDARLTLLNKFHNILKSAELALAFMGVYLLDENWWKDHHEPVTPSTLNIIVSEYNQFAKIGFFHQFFGALESSYRIFLRRLNPDAAKQGTAE